MTGAASEAHLGSDVDLQAVAGAWPSLPLAVRAAIATLVRATLG